MGSGISQIVKLNRFTIFKLAIFRDNSICDQAKGLHLLRKVRDVVKPNENVPTEELKVCWTVTAVTCLIDHDELCPKFSHPFVITDEHFKQFFFHGVTLA